MTTLMTMTITKRRSANATRRRERSVRRKRRNARNMDAEVAMMTMSTAPRGSLVAMVAAGKSMAEVERSTVAVDKSMEVVDKSMVEVGRNMGVVDKNLVAVDRSMAVADKNTAVADKSMEVATRVDTEAVQKVALEANSLMAVAAMSLMAAALVMDSKAMEVDVRRVALVVDEASTVSSPTEAEETTLTAVVNLMEVDKAMVTKATVAVLKSMEVVTTAALARDAMVVEMKVMVEVEGMETAKRGAGRATQCLK